MQGVTVAGIHWKWIFILLNTHNLKIQPEMNIKSLTSHATAAESPETPNSSEITFYILFCMQKFSLEQL